MPNPGKDGIEGRVIDAMKAARLPVTVSEFSGTFSPTTIQAALDRLVEQGAVRCLNAYTPPRYKLVIGDA